MTHGLGPGKPGPRAAKPITPPYVENNYRIEVKITFMLIAYLVLLCEFFWEFSIFHFCRPPVDIYWHPLLSRRSWGHERRPEVTRASVNVLRMCLRPRGQVADTRTPLLNFKMEREILVFESSRLGRRIIPKLLAYNQGKIRLTRLTQAGCRTRRRQDLRDLRKIRAVNPPRLQPLKIDGESVIDGFIMQVTWRHFLGKTREKDVVLIVTFDLIGLLSTSHKLLVILQWHTGVCEETFTVNRKIAQTTQNIWNFIVRESNLQEMANFGDYPEIWQPCKIYSVSVHADHRQVNSHLI